MILQSSDGDIHVRYLSGDPGAVEDFLRASLPPAWRLTSARSATEKSLDDVDYLVVAATKVPRAAVETAPQLKVVHKFGVGYDDIDTAALIDRDIPLAICSLGSSEAVAEHAVALALMGLKTMGTLDRAVRDERRWPRWDLRRSIRQVWTQNVGLVGYGRIGQETARLFSAFKCELGIYSRTSPSDVGAGIRIFKTLDELCEWASVVSIHVPLSPATRHLVGRRQLDLLGPEGLLVNTSRGEIVDQVALVSALRDGTLGAAALDVLAVEPPKPDDPILGLGNVVITPHVGGGGLDVFERKARYIADNLVRFHETGDILGRVAFAAGGVGAIVPTVQ